MLAEQADGTLGQVDVDVESRRLVVAADRRRAREHALADAHDPGAGRAMPGDGGEQRRLARTVRAEHREHLGCRDRDRDVEPEVAHLGDHPGVERPARRAGHRGASSRQLRMSTSTATATRMSMSDSAIAMSSLTPAPLNAV